MALYQSGSGLGALVGVGTTNPTSNLQVYGTPIAAGNVFSVLNTAASGNVAQFSSSTGTALIINSIGNVGIGTTNPTSNLQVVGNVLSGNVISSVAMYGVLAGANTIAASSLTLTNALAVLYGGTGTTTSTGSGSVVLSSGPTLSGTTSIATLNLTNALGTTYGGTGLTSFTSGGLLYASSTSALASSGAYTAGQILYGGGAGTAPASSSSLFWDSGNSRLGIGTASPYSKLDVSGAITTTSATTTSHGVISQNNGEFLSIEACNSGNTGKLPVALCAYGGNVGIGLTNPSSKLHIDTTSTYGIITSGSNFGHRIVYGNYGVSSYQDGSTFYYLLTNSGDQYGSYNTLRPFYFSLSTGYVTMGCGATISGGFTANGGSTLNGGATVSGDFRVSGSWYWAPGANYYLDATAANQEWSFDIRGNATYAGLQWQVWSDTKSSVLVVNGDSGVVNIPYKLGLGTNNPGSAIAFAQPIANKLITLYDGNAADAVGTATNFYGFGINGSTLRYQSPDTGTVHKFYTGATVAATIAATAATFAGDVIAYSDRRIKADLIPIDDALDKLICITGYTYTRTDHDDKEKRHAGVIAQEVQKVLPEVVHEDKDGHLSVAYGNLTALLIEAVKEERQKREAVTCELRSLEERIKLLEQK